MLTFQETDMSQYPPKCPGGEGAEIQSLPLSICELKTFGGEWVILEQPNLIALFRAKFTDILLLYLKTMEEIRELYL